MRTMTKGEKLAIGGAVAAVAATLGLWYYEKHKAASGPVYFGGGVIPYTLTPGVMTPVALSLSGDNQLALTPPTGVTAPANVVSTDATTVSVGTPAGATVTATAVKIGTTALSAVWTDASGTSQTSTITVTVSA